MENGIKVSRTELLRIIQTNREIHRREFNEAYVAFRQTALDELRKNLKAAEDGKAIELHVYLDHPVSHLEEYDDVIGLLEMGSDDEVTLTSKDYRKYVRDEWPWTDGFKKTRVFYAAKQIGIS